VTDLLLDGNQIRVSCKIGAFFITQQMVMSDGDVFWICNISEHVLYSSCRHLCLHFCEFREKGNCLVSSSVLFCVLELCVWFCSVSNYIHNFVACADVLACMMFLMIVALCCSQACMPTLNWSKACEMNMIPVGWIFSVVLRKITSYCYFTDSAAWLCFVNIWLSRRLNWD